MHFSRIIALALIFNGLGTASHAKSTSPLLEIYEPKITGPGRISYDSSHPLMVIHDVQRSQLAADGKGVMLRLTSKDTKRFAALTTSHLGRYLVLRATDQIVEIMHITGVIRDGHLDFRYPVEENVAGYLRKRLNLSEAAAHQLPSPASTPESAAIAAESTDDAAKDANGANQNGAPPVAPASEAEATLKSQIEKALGKSNRDVPRLSDVQFAGQAITVRFSIDDNLTENLIKGSARSDVRDILKAIQDSSYPYSQLTAIGTFALRDKFGNSHEDEVLRATYKRSTVDRINWVGFRTDDTYEIADDVWLHPTFQKKLSIKDLEVTP